MPHIAAAELNQTRFDPIQNRLLTSVEEATRRAGFVEEFGEGRASMFRAAAENLRKFDLELAAIQGRIIGEAGIRETGLQIFEEATRAAGFTRPFGGGRAERFRADPENLARFQQELRTRAPEVIFADTPEALAIQELGFTGTLTTRGDVDIRGQFVTPELEGAFATLTAQAKASIAAGGVVLTGDDPNVVQESGLTLFAEREIAVETGFVLDVDSPQSFDEQLEIFLNTSPGVRTEFNSRVSRELGRQIRIFGTAERFRKAIGIVAKTTAISAGLGFAKFATGIKAGAFIDAAAAKAFPSLFAIGEITTTGLGLTVAESVLVAQANTAALAAAQGLSPELTAFAVEQSGKIATEAALSEIALANESVVLLSNVLAAAGIGYAVSQINPWGADNTASDITSSIAAAATVLSGGNLFVAAAVAFAVDTIFGAFGLGPDPATPQSNFFAPMNSDGVFREGETRFASKTQSTQFSIALGAATQEFTSALGTLGVRFFGQEGLEGVFGGNLGRTAHITLNFPTSGINVKVDFPANDAEAISKGIVEAMLQAIDSGNTSPLTNQALATVSSKGLTVPEYLNALQLEVVRLAKEAGFVDEDGEVLVAGAVDDAGLAVVDIDGEPIKVSPEKRVKTSAQIQSDQIADLIGGTKAGVKGIKATIKTGPSGLLDIAPTRRRRLVGGI